MANLDTAEQYCSACLKCNPENCRPCQNIITDDDSIAATCDQKACCRAKCGIPEGVNAQDFCEEMLCNINACAPCS